MIPIGVMQGRLSPPVGGRLQAFPVDAWREEFPRAREAGLSCIEWIYEAETDGLNPLRSDAGIGEIRRLADQSGVRVWSICADYFLVERLVLPGGAVGDAAVQQLRWLIGRAAALGMRYIVLPFLDSSSLQSPQEIAAMRELLRVASSAAAQARIELHLETDLPALEVAAVLHDLSHPWVRANFDTGNSAALGHDPAQELTVLGPWIGSVHIKDRLRDGPSVPLGTGAADFAACFRFLRAAGFRGSFILQTARDGGLNEIELAIRNRQFVERHLMAVA